MRKIHYLATFLALLLLCTTAKASIQASSDYVETFDELEVSGHDFAPPFWGHIVDSYFDYDYYEEYYVSYQHVATGGWNGSGYLKAGTQSLGEGWTTTDVNDLLVSPKVSGQVSFYLKQMKGSGKVRLYSCTVSNGRYKKGSEIKIADMPQLSTSEWTQVTINVAEPTYIGFRLENIGLDEFHAQNAEVVAKKSMEIVKVKYIGNSDLPANADNKVNVKFNVILKNTGDAVLNPGDKGYELSIVSYKSPSVELGRTAVGVSLQPGQTSEEIQVEALCDAGSQKANARYDIKEHITETTAFGAWITFIPYLPELQVNLTDQTTDFEVVKEQPHSLNVELYNAGGAPLHLTSIDAPQGFEFSEALPLQLDNAQRAQLTITLKPGDEWAGVKDGQIVFHYNDSYQKAIDVTGVVLANDTWYEDFEAGIPENYIHSDNWKEAPTSSTDLTTRFNKKWIQNSVQTPLTDIITPKMHVAAGQSLTFYAAKRTNYGGELTISYSTDRKEWVEVRHLKYDAADAADRFSDEKASYTSYEFKFKKYELSNIPEGDYYLKFSAGFVLLDNIYGFQQKIEEHDLYIRECILPSKAAINTPYNTTITLQNFGEKEMAGNYTVKLLSNNDIVAEATTADLEMNAQQTYKMSFIPHELGERPFRIVIEAPGYRIESEAVTVEVQPEPAETSYTAGKHQQSNSRVPLAINFKKSMSETIYQPKQAGMTEGAEIVRLSYLFYNVAEKNFPANIKIWMENTADEAYDEETFEAADTLQMEQVYDGVWNITTEGNEQDWFEKVFMLDKAFVYSGQNIRVVIKSEANEYCNVTFATEPVTTIKSMVKYNDVNLVDAYWNASSHLPVANFYVRRDIPTVSGKVTDQLTGQPIAALDIKLTAGNIWYNGTTDEDGNYSIPVIQAYNTYVLTAQREGFADVLQEIELSGSSIVKDIELTHVMPKEPEECTVKFLLSTVTGESAEGATVHLFHNDYGIDYGTRNANAKGFCIFNLVTGYYTIEVEKPGYKKVVNDNFAIPGNITFEIELAENVVDPYALNTELSHNILTGQNDLTLTWNHEAPAFFDDFESYEDFSINFGEWTGVDKDGDATAPLLGSYKNRGMPQYATICNPLTVTPTWWYDFPVLRPFSGQQYVGFIRTQSGRENDDWLISPSIKVGTNHILRFLAKSGDQYKERFQVGVAIGSTDPEDFEIISSGNYETVNYEAWEEKIYDLSAYEGEEVYIAIHYVSKASFMLMIDDFYVGPNNIVPIACRVPRRSPANPVEVFDIYLDNEKVGETDTYSYIFNDIAEGEHTLGVKARYTVSESKLSTCQVNVPGSNNYAAFKATITTNNGQNIDLETMELVNKNTGEQYNLEIANNNVYAASVPKGAYITSISVDNYELYQKDVQIDGDITLEVNLIEELVTPYNLTTDTTEEEGRTNVLFKWNQDLGFYDSFESYEDFSSEFGNWTVFDLDKMPVYPIALGDVNNVISFPGSGTAEQPQPTKTMVFNPYATSPSMESDSNILAPDGKKSVVFFSAQRAESNDWLISPVIKIRNNYVWEVAAKAYDVFPENIEFAASTSKDPSTFVVLDKVQLTKEWIKYSLDLSAYADQEVYLGIHYITNDGFLSQVDMFYVGPDKEIEQAAKVGVVEHYEVMLDNVLVGKPTTNSFLFEDVADGEHTASVKAVYRSGESETASITFNVLSGIAETTAGCIISGHRGFIRCELCGEARVMVVEASGQLVAQQDCPAGESIINLPAGTYIVQIATPQQHSSHKVLVF